MTNEKRNSRRMIDGRKTAAMQLLQEAEKQEDFTPPANKEADPEAEKKST